MTGRGRLPATAPAAEPGVIRGGEVSLTCVSPGRDSRPEATLIYTLRAGEPWLMVTQEFRNVGETSFPLRMEDALFAAGPSFERAPQGDAPFFWAYDRWFGQAYGLAAEGAAPRVRQSRDETTLTWLHDGGETVPLEPGRTFVLTRRLFPSRDLAGIRQIDAAIRETDRPAIAVRVVDDAGAPVPGADLSFENGGPPVVEARTDVDGRARLFSPAGNARLRVLAPGLPPRTFDPVADGATLEAGSASRLAGRVTDDSGRPIPCKIIVTGTGDTPSPDFGPEVGEEAVGNLLYSPDGRFEHPLSPGTYEITISHGPEHDTATRSVEIPPGGGRVDIDVSLARRVDTAGWISADFHGHTTSSGDTTASRRGRVLNLAAEQVDFAPATEHNRIDTYEEEIRSLGLADHLATCAGLELTNLPMSIGHQNAFPLSLKPRTQGHGAPPTDRDPIRQIRRLAGWDDGSEKLVQQNHPDLGWMFFDANEDGARDDGFAGMLEHQDVIEVWADNILKQEPLIYRPGPAGAGGPPAWTVENNRIFNWLQMLNQGMRAPGVANTDSHLNFHGSGGVRNYVRSGTDDPAHIDPLDIVRHAERGHIVMTNGPYLEVTARAAAATGGMGAAIPGDDLAAPSGEVELSIRVQCPNWIDIDRVHLLLNGRIAEPFAFTRYKHPKRFGNGVVKFDQTLTLRLERDTHVIVVAADKRPHLAKIMGPFWGQFAPVAVANPVFVDVDGGGFQANGDTLGHPLPVKGGRTVTTLPPGR